MKVKSGFTLIELLVVISIISLLSSVVLSSLNSARSKARFAQVIQTMYSIEKAVALDYNDNGYYAGDVGAGGSPTFVQKYLSGWPTPPCPGWTYDYENWSNGNTVLIRISLRHVANSATVYFYCIDNNTGNCSSGDGTDIKTLTNRTLTCNE